jgi:GMP synthase (glutamine-hydrolysing)
MGEYEIGYRTVEQDGENRLLEGIEEDMTVFTTHSDHVVKEPPGATVFAKNDYGIHGFRKGRVFAVQFHPEYDKATAEEIARGKDELPDERIETVLEGINAENYAAACEVKQLFDNFRSFVEDIQQVRVDAG